MPAFKDDYSNRMQNAAAARKALVEKFKSQPKADDPSVQERIAQQVAMAKARDERVSAKKAQKEAERVAALRTAWGAGRRGRRLVSSRQW